MIKQYPAKLTAHLVVEVEHRWLATGWWLWLHHRILWCIHGVLTPLHTTRFVESTAKPTTGEGKGPIAGAASAPQPREQHRGPID